MDLVAAAKKQVLIASHRGEGCGNIPGNSMPAMMAAYLHGSDILEIDLNRTKDGQLIIFHPGQERNALGFTGCVRDYTLKEIQSVLRFTNASRAQTEWSVVTFDEVLETFKGKCFLNTDKFWDFPADIVRAIQRHGMMDQILVKTEPKEDVLRVLEELAPDIMFMPVYHTVMGDWHENIRHRNINYVGAELVFPTEDCESGLRETRQFLKKEGLILWANALLYNYRKPLSAGHTDDVSVTGNPDLGWGWLCDEGFDIIQTDWTLALSQYLKKTGRRK